MGLYGLTAVVRAFVTSSQPPLSVGSGFWSGSRPSCNSRSRSFPSSSAPPCLLDLLNIRLIISRYVLRIHRIYFSAHHLHSVDSPQNVRYLPCLGLLSGAPASTTLGASTLHISNACSPEISYLFAEYFWSIVASGWREQDTADAHVWKARCR